MILALALLGCAFITEEDHRRRLAALEDPAIDLDEDGYTEADGDCDDANAAVHPGAEEVCDRLDQDCDGAVDESPSDGVPAWTDADGDGFGAPGATTSACLAPGGALAAGYADNDGDCHDDDATAFPGSHAPETPKDGVDQDCDGLDRCTDLNCDGYPDVFVVGGTGTTGGLAPILYGGPPQGSESPGTLLRGETALQVFDAQGAVAADFDRDGYLDLAVTGYTPEARGWLEVRFGGPTGIDTSTTARINRVDLPIRPIALHLGDMNDDGWPDLFVGSGGARDSTGGFDMGYPSAVYVNRAGLFNSELANEIIVFSDRPYASVFQDVDGDGLDDLLVGAYDDPALAFAASRLTVSTGTTFFSGGARTFAARFVRDLHLVDLDDNGHLDALFVQDQLDGDYDGAMSLIYWNFDDGAMVDDLDRVQVPGAVRARVHDLDNDGELDLIFASTRRRDGAGPLARAEESEVRWGRSAVPFEPRTTFAVNGAADVAVGDFDLDGRLDLVYSSTRWLTAQISANAAVYLQTSPRFQGVTGTSLQTAGASRVAAADLDDDGRLDLVFAGAALPGLSSGSPVDTTVRWFHNAPETDEGPPFSVSPSGTAPSGVDAAVLLVIGGV